MTRAIRKFIIAAMIILGFNRVVVRPEENSSVFNLILANVNLNESDLSITGTIALKNRTNLEYTIPYFLFGLNNPTILLTINGKNTSYSHVLLEASMDSPTTVDPFSTITEDFRLELRKEDFAQATADVNNPGVFRIRLQSKYRSVYVDFRSLFPIRSNPANLWLGELTSNTVEVTCPPECGHAKKP